MKMLTPIFAFIIACGLIVTYVRPTLADIKALQTQTTEYQTAMDKVNELRGTLDSLKEQARSITPAQRERLEAMVPDRISEVAVLRDFDALAQKNRLVLGSSLVTRSDKKSEGGMKQVPVAEKDPAEGGEPSTIPQGDVQPLGYIPVEFSLSLSGTFFDFKTFMEEVEKSLVFSDVISVEFSRPEGDVATYLVKVRMYLFNPGI